MVARIALGLVALVVAAWFALGTVQVRDTNRAAAIVAQGSRLSPAQVDRAHALLSSAATLNPDSGVDLLRSEVAYLRGQRGQATQILERVVGREPMNADAWLLLARAAYPNPAIIHRALRHIARLDPRR
jgi:predicted Zn-dependent protease